MTNTPLPTTDATAATASKTVAALFSDLVPVAETLAIAADPVLGSPFLKPIWQWLFKYFVNLFGSAAGTASAFVVMEIQEYRNLTNAASALAGLKAAQASGDANELAQANTAMDSAVTPILHYVGDARPGA